MATKTKKLTELQKKLLADMPDGKFVFPGSLQSQSYRKLESMGLVESELLLKKRNNATGVSEFQQAYKRIAAGDAFLASS